MKLNHQANNILFPDESDWENGDGDDFLRFGNLQKTVS